MNDFGLKWQKFVDVVVNKGGYRDILEGLGNTIKIAVIGLIIGILIGTVIAAVKVMPKYKRLPRVLDRIFSIYVGFFRGTPMVVQLLIGYFVIFPLMGVGISSVDCCIIIFGLNSAAYVSEIMRSGIQSVDIGQMEAGRALGLSYGRTMLSVVIPQAVKNILPTLGNEFITLIKETSVINFIGATDLCTAFKKIGTNSYEFMVPYIVMAVCYIVMVYLISLIIKLVERRLKKSDRRN